jgi:hypothetical protein
MDANYFIHKDPAGGYLLKDHSGQWSDVGSFKTEREAENYMYDLNGAQSEDELCMLIVGVEK